MYLPTGVHTDKAVCIAMRRNHGMHRMPHTRLATTKVLLPSTAIKDTPNLMGSVHVPSGESKEAVEPDTFRVAELHG